MRYRDLEPPFSISFSTPSLHLSVTEVGDDDENYVEFDAYCHTKGDQSRFRMTFARCLEARMVSFMKRPPHPIVEILDSEWVASLQAKQAQAYPRDASILDDIRHFVVTGHDAHVEVIAESYSWSKVGF